VEGWRRSWLAPVARTEGATQPVSGRNPLSANLLRGQETSVEEVIGGGAIEPDLGRNAVGAQMGVSTV